jgi:hypothetical protein
MWLTAPTLFLGHPVYIMSQNGPGNLLFFELVFVLPSCRDKCSILIRRRVVNQISFEVKKIDLFGHSKTLDT